MPEPVKIQVSLDEKTKERLRPMAGQNQASLAVMLGRIIESGLDEKKRLLAGIVRRIELAQAGALAASDRAGGLPVPLPVKRTLQLGELGEALDLAAGGVAGLIVKVVVEDKAWMMSIFTDTLSDIGRPR